MTEINLSPISALARDRYSRSEAMVEAGLRSFIPALRFQEDFASSLEELREYREFAVRSAMFHLGTDEDFSQWIERKRVEAACRFAETGKSWENEFVSFRRHYKKMLALEERDLKEFTQPYKDEMDRLWQEEVAGFAEGCVESLLAKGKKNPSRTALYKDLMGRALEEWGFEQDQEISTTRELVYSRHLARGYKLAFMLDLVNLRQPVGQSSMVENTGEMLSASGPSFAIWVELRKPSRVGSGSERIIGIGFDWLFPIREFPLGTNCYAKFCELRELEALINIHLTLYRIIQPELDEALALSL